ncbi:MAG: hypothetical protein J0M07_20645 [Anaerolineae bacterium]|nr:hypothetical protein [Anaerolineae bacterium]
MDTDPLRALPPEPTPTRAPNRRQRSAALPSVILVIAGLVFAIFWLRPAQKSLEFEDFRIVYDSPWYLSGTALWATCEDVDLWDCDAAFASRYTEILIARFVREIPPEVDAATIEAINREPWLERNPTVSFVRVENLMIDGQPAVARILSGITVDASVGANSGYRMSIFVKNGGWLYQFDIDSISQEHFEQDRAMVMALLGGFEFRHRIVEGNT